MSKQQEELTLDFLDDFEEEEVQVSPAEVEDEIEEQEAKKEEETDEVIDESEKEEEEEVETDEEETESEPPTLISELATSFGYEFEEEFEDSPEGVTALTRAVAERMADEHLSGVLDAVPEMKEFYEYVQLGGDPKKFVNTKFPDVNYETLKFSDDDENQHIQLVKAEMKLRGYSPEDIEQELDDYKNGGILDSKAKRALANLKKNQKMEKDTLLDQQAKAKEAADKEALENWNTIQKQIAQTQALKGINIPEKDKKPFFEYLSKPVQEGKSQRLIDGEQADLETRLAIDFLLFKGFKLSELIGKKATTDAARSLRERLNGTKKPSQVTDKPAKSGANENLASLHDVI